MWYFENTSRRFPMLKLKMEPQSEENNSSQDRDTDTISTIRDEDEEEDENDNNGEDIDEKDDSSNSEAEIESVDYEKRRETTLKRLLVLEKQFGKLREELFRERLQQVSRRQNELSSLASSDCVRKVTALDDEQRKRLETAEMSRFLQLKQLDRIVEGETKAIGCDFENDRLLLFDNVERDIRTKLDTLKNDKMKADISLTLWMATDRQKSKENSKKLKSNKRHGSTITVSGPYIVYMAKDEDVQSDWLTIRKATIQAELRDKMHHNEGFDNQELVCDSLLPIISNNDKHLDFLTV